MLNHWKRAGWIFIYAGLLFGMILSACQSSLLRAGNPLIKSAPVIHPSETPTEIAPYPTQEPTNTAEVQEEQEMENITITIVFDNYPYQKGLGTAWGFSAFITYKNDNVLFDTGAGGSLLLSNMAALDIKPAQVQNIVLSHEHNDHTGGLQALLSAGANPKIFIPPSFSSGFKGQFNSQAEVIEVTPNMQIIERVHTIGEMGGSVPEQALVIDTTRGLIVITGCAHPGVDKIVLEAKRQYKEDIYLVLGGFHLGSATTSQVNEIIQALKQVGVKQIAPCHCTGDQAINQIKNAFGEDFIPVGVGAVIDIEL